MLRKTALKSTNEAKIKCLKTLQISSPSILLTTFRSMTRDVKQSEKIWNTGLLEKYWNIKRIFSSCLSDTKL